MAQVRVLAATAAAALLVAGAILAVANDRLVLGGTLLVFTAFAIYVRETAPDST